MLSSKATNRLTLGKKEAEIDFNMSMPRRMPNFMRPIHLNNFAFSLDPPDTPNADMYEYRNGRFFKLVEIIRPGRSFAELSLHRKTYMPVSIKADTPVEYALLSKEHYE